MNILMMTSKNDKYGAQRVFLDQAAALHRMDHNVVVVGRGVEGFVADAVRSLGIEYHGIPMKGVRDLLFLLRLVKKKSTGVIHTSLDRADYFGAVVSWLTGRPRVSTMNVRRYHIGYRFADRVVTVSNKQRDLLLANGIKADRISVIRPWIDSERYAKPVAEKRDAWRRKLGSDGFSIVFCHISSIIPQKSHPVSLELAYECKKCGEEPLLIIAGDPLQGDYYESLVKEISRRRLEKNVIFTGWSPELPELLSLSHFTLLPSFHEAFGMVLLEGMAAGTPIVAREGEGGAELIEEFGTGFLYRPAEGVSRLADDILALWRDPRQYKTLSDKCRDVARNDFSVERFGRRLVGLYQSIGK
jgi:glycosyltransferase involved in cell wall biosynthesis